jgi:hypothetical protein
MKKIGKCRGKPFAYFPLFCVFQVVRNMNILHKTAKMQKMRDIVKRYEFYLDSDFAKSEK